VSPEITAAVDRAQAISRSSPVIVVFADLAYADVLANWLEHTQKLGVRNILIVALDPQTFEAATSRGIACALLPKAASRAELWATRVELFAALATAGVDFVHSDADAVWLRSPIDELFGQQVDLAFSQGTRLPVDVLARWGFVLCCGLFAARATAASRTFFAAVANRIKIDRDDQVAVNRLLFLANTSWRIDQPGEVRTWKGASFRTFEKPVFGSCGDLKLALMPHAQFTRLPEISPRTMVAHPLPSPSDREVGQRRTGKLRRLGLWRLPESSSAG
jgi:hypothetical protein